jgi:transposase
MSEVCRQFGISRKTGYKIFNRYKAQGLQALSDRSRRPVRYANQLPPQIESQIVALKREKPHWVARKIRELLVRRLVRISEERDRSFRHRDRRFRERDRSFR